MTGAIDPDPDHDLEAVVARSVDADKPGLEEMRAWVAQWEPCVVRSAEIHHEVYGDFNDGQIRNIAVVRALVRFIGRCAECSEDLKTAFRAAEHRKKWKRT